MNRSANTWKKLLSALLCVSLLCAAFAPPISAELNRPDKPAPWLHPLYNAGDFLARGLLGAITALFPPPPGLSWEFGDPMLPPGTGTFIDAPAGARTWSLGYAKASLLEGYDIYEGRHYVMGSIGLTGQRKPTGIYDDQAVRVTAMSDGSGRGTVIFISIDAYGITSAEIHNIRRAALALDGMADVVSINVSSLPSTASSTPWA